jgi:hypothetical protein
MQPESRYPTVYVTPSVKEKRRHFQATTELGITATWLNLRTERISLPSNCIPDVMRPFINFGAVSKMLINQSHDATGSPPSPGIYHVMSCHVMSWVLLRVTAYWFVCLNVTRYYLYLTQGCLLNNYFTLRMTVTDYRVIMNSAVFGNGEIMACGYRTYNSGWSSMWNNSCKSNEMYQIP